MIFDFPQPVENNLRTPHADGEVAPPQSPDQWQVDSMLYFKLVNRDVCFGGDSETLFPQ